MTVCPNCLAPVPVLDLYDLAEARGITGHALYILEALWEARGMRVMSATLFDAIWADDPEGGPGPNQCYVHTRRAIEELQKSLSGTGVMVVTAGHRKGYRLEIDGTGA